SLIPPVDAGPDAPPDAPPDTSLPDAGMPEICDDPEGNDEDGDDLANCNDFDCASLPVCCDGDDGTVTLEEDWDDGVPFTNWESVSVNPGVFPERAMNRIIDFDTVRTGVA